MNPIITIQSFAAPVLVATVEIPWEDMPGISVKAVVRADVVFNEDGVWATFKDWKADSENPLGWDWKNCPFYIMEAVVKKEAVFELSMSRLPLTPNAGIKKTVERAFEDWLEKQTEAAIKDRGLA